VERLLKVAQDPAPSALVEVALHRRREGVREARTSTSARGVGTHTFTNTCTHRSAIFTVRARNENDKQSRHGVHGA
jgi:hypothetical protein